MKCLTRKKIMLLLRSVFVIALFSVAVFNMMPVKADKDYSQFDFNTLEEQNKDRWLAYCNDAFVEYGKKEQEKCYDTLTANLKKFYEKMYKILSKYQERDLYINDQVILWTVFFSQFSTPSTDADSHKVNADDNLSLYEQFAKDYFGFNLDESDGSDVSVDVDYSKIDYYAKETDTLKTLIRNAVAYATVCYGVNGTPTVTTAEDGSKHYECQDGYAAYDNIVGESGYVCAQKISYNEMGFWKYFTSKIAHDERLGIFQNVFFLGKLFPDPHYDECIAKEGYERVHYQYEDDPHVSYTMYFDFLKENRYFDGKSNLQYYFEDVLMLADVDCLMDDVCENSLQAKDAENPGEYDKWEERLMQDRLKIIYDILEFLDYYGIGIEYAAFIPESKLIPGGGAGDRTAYYWPIGSDATEERDGITYADKDPASTTITSYFGKRTHPITGEEHTHTGIDIAGKRGETNVIASEKGEVISIVNTCTEGDLKCGGGYGNHIIISHSDGYFTLYGHLASVDPAVNVGGSVMKGQVIGKVGSTGNSTGPHLHFEVRKDTNSSSHAIDPLTILSVSQPRPTGYKGGDFSMRKTALSKEEFVSALKNYCNSGKCNGSKGLQYFAERAETIYDLSTQNGLNPEFTVVRAISEGFSPHFTCNSSSNNHWGIGCSNGGGCGACSKYSSFENGIVGLSNLGIVKKYDSALEVFTKGHYAYIGDRWLSPGNSADGGCYYFPHIKEYYTDTARRAEVESACSRSCSGSSCLKTNDADQEAYGYYQIRGMTKARYNIWGL